MKKFWAVLLGMLLLSCTAEARWHRGRGHWEPVRVVHHRHDYVPVALAAGIVGTAVGSYIAANQYRNTVIQQGQYYPPENDKQCFVVVSKSTGNVTKKCVNVSDDNNYEVLYVD